jgi:hypothetical protein
MNTTNGTTLTGLLEFMVGYWRDNRSRQVMRLSSIAIVLLALGLTSCASTPDTQEEYWISTSIPFAENSGVTDKVKVECNLDTELPPLIAAESTKSFRIIRTPNPLDDVENAGKTVLYLQFTHISGLPGGTYSGVKRAKVRGELKKDGEVIASFLASRRTLGGLSGTCGMLRHINKALVRDITTWLENPTMDAKLGDAR